MSRRSYGIAQFAYACTASFRARRVASRVFDSVTSVVTCSFLSFCGFEHRLKAEGYTKALAKQTIEKGIRANVVAPGPFWTALQPSGGQPDEKVEKFGEDSDFGRPGQPVELAPIYVLLASQEASYINGEVFGVTGGKGVA